ncbi:response regulator [Geomonas oryzae]|uniref:response regulator n=1 Tax=Geomonas oryzae TaxID=2364273 RepID=UPI00100B8996|nr:response regulator [Geomonas oryzae]
MSDHQTRILCVDDERNVLRALERIFIDDDYEILTAASGEEGLELLNASPQVQVVISDFRMPGMNGVEFLKEVFKTHPETIRIVLSGYADTAAVVAAINEGKIYKFIPKPWNDDELRVTVAKALEHFATQRRNEQLAEELRRKTDELRELNADLARRAASCSCGFMQEHEALAHAAVILDHLPFGVLALNGDGVVLQMNREAADLLQVADGQLVGRRLAEALPQFADLSDGLSASTPGSGAIETGGYRLNLRQFHPPGDGAVELVVTIARAA